MNYKTIHKLIMSGLYADLQSSIDSGLCWKLEGSFGRAAMEALESGACILGKEPQKDYYGNIVPSYNQVAKGSKGSLERAFEYYNED